MKYKYKKLKLKNGSTIDEHRFVMQQHLGRSLQFNECVHHINGNKKDNRLENLEVISRSEHTKNHFLDGTLKPPPRPTDEQKESLSNRFRGEGSNSAVLTESDVVTIKKMLLDGYSNSYIAKIFSIGSTAISKIKTGKRWKHVVI